MVDQQQYAALDALGIPVWHQRASQFPEDDLMTISQETSYIVCHDVNNQQQQQLLGAILFAVDLTIDECLTLSIAEGIRLSFNADKLPALRYLLLFSDDTLAQDSNKIILLPSLSRLIQTPSLKKVVWQRLQTAFLTVS